MIRLRKSPGYPFVFINTPVSGLPELFIRTLDLETSYLVQNPDRVIAARNAKLIKQGIKPEPWDGRIRLLKQSKQGNYYFPVGLLQTVIKTLKWYGVEPELDIRFNETEQEIPIEWRGPSLRDYQVDAFIRAKSSERCITQLPTGSGKSLLALKLITTLKKPTLLVVHTKELFNQWVENFEKYTTITPSKFNDKTKEFGFVTIAMVQSLDKWLQKKENKPPLFDVLVLDEAHHTPANTFYNVAMKCDARYRFGLTATTKREDGTDLLMVAGLGPIVTQVKPEDLVKCGSLSQPKFEFLSVPPTMIYGNTYQEIYKSGIVLNTERNALIIQRSKQLAAEGRQVYIHVEHIMHGKLLADISGFPFVYSATKNRSDIIDGFRSGDVPVLISTLLGEGVDIPNISAIIMAGGRKTEIGTIQKVGRALRPSDKSDAIVVDFLDKGKYLSIHAVNRYHAYIKFFGEYVLESVQK